MLPQCHPPRPVGVSLQILLLIPKVRTYKEACMERGVFVPNNAGTRGKSPGKARQARRNLSAFRFPPLLSPLLDERSTGVALQGSGTPSCNLTISRYIIPGGKQGSMHVCGWLERLADYKETRTTNHTTGQEEERSLNFDFLQYCCMPCNSSVRTACT